MQALPIPESTNVFLYVEYPRPGQLNRCAWGDAAGYFALRPPWDRIDTYVLPETLQWCIAYTHEDIKGTDAILVAGSTPTAWGLRAAGQTPGGI
jgi:hypothetical protein